jgi:8-oxo-dGTP diphosphatase
MQYDSWRGQDAAALQAALRLTNEAFADTLGVAVRTVAGWRSKPGTVPRSEMQRALDTLLDRSPAAGQARFHQSSGGDLARPSHGPQHLRAAIAVVVHDRRVLLVNRRADSASSIRWQFPAGIIKPGASVHRTAERETLAETAIHCAVRRCLGSRVHPVTHVLCDYVLCDYLTGEAVNLDPVENVDVAWANLDRVTSFIPAETIYPPVLEALTA